MPHIGWLVDLDRQRCECAYFNKMRMCAHVVAALKKLHITSTARDPLQQLKNRIAESKKKKRGSSKQKKVVAKKKRSSTQIQPRQKASKQHQASATSKKRGRPANAAPAMTVQDVLIE
ncbi:hypothetical protein PHYSODRAFT_329851 [Phytophthora sojae]|uniref:SWIM-type domain-containing protein n=1 Tax=Phytophthora sojae (strain P6497) TaxID=1094619 RepID=G4ZA78_PHYSP|nr:hypothetical protein PHYSODRAFT_329851 [Phytophthora sojae]EGZ21963.1 hypothetical protein PHYSODRAFT_329851 [Phytophthora sojae]|eukprot:XP_009524680.1 hypothetical protein PHYSODRAFT_329851 [Phytophthora sojae]